MDVRTNILSCLSETNQSNKINHDIFIIPFLKDTFVIESIVSFLIRQLVKHLGVLWCLIYLLSSKVKKGSKQDVFESNVIACFRRQETP